MENLIVTNMTSDEIKVEEESVVVVHTEMAPLSVDYPTEALNDMARAINELIKRENER